MELTFSDDPQWVQRDPDRVPQPRQSFPLRVEGTQHVERIPARRGQRSEAGSYRRCLFQLRPADIQLATRGVSFKGPVHHFELSILFFLQLL